MNKAYIYIRVSTSKQTDGYSLKSQSELCLNLVHSRGLELGTETNCDEPGVFIDAQSAFRYQMSDRPGGRAMISSLSSGDTIVLYDISRGWRSTYDFAKSVNGWLAAGVNILFVSYPSLDLTTANGRLTASVMAAYAEWKSAISSERLKEYHAAKRNGLIESKPEAVVISKVKSKVVSTPESRAIVEVLYPKPEVVVSDEPSVHRVFGYVRVSTDDQTVESQIGPVEAYMNRLLTAAECTDQKLKSEGIFSDEGVSALKVNFRDREQARELLGELRSGDHIVFLRPARAFRSVKDMVNTIDMLHEIGITVHLAEGGMKSGDMNFTMCMQIMVLMAQIESEENSRRVKDAHTFLKENGLPSCIQKQNLAPWLRVVRIDANHRTVLPNEDYLADAQMAQAFFNNGMGLIEVARKMEEFVAWRECRFPVPVFGMDPTIAQHRSRRQMLGNPFARKMQAKFRDQIDKAIVSKRDVRPSYSLSQIKRMKSDLKKYEHYLEVLNRDGVEGTAEAVSSQ